MFLFFQDFAKDRYGVPAMVQSQQKLGVYESCFPSSLVNQTAAFAKKYGKW